MPNKNPYELDFEEYIRNTEPEKRTKHMPGLLLLVYSR